MTIRLKMPAGGLHRQTSSSRQTSGSCRGDRGFCSETSCDISGFDAVRSIANVRKGRVAGEDDLSILLNLYVGRMRNRRFVQRNDDIEKNRSTMGNKVSAGNQSGPIRVR